MSMNIYIYPTSSTIPTCRELVDYSIDMLTQFLSKIEINSIIFRTNKKEPSRLVFSEREHTTFKFCEHGAICVFYHDILEIDREVLYDEVKEKNIKNPEKMIKLIDANYETGYSWCVKRTMGQPPLISLYFGFLAIAIAKVTNGIIYSDDGAWDYSCFPIVSSDFQKLYLDTEKIRDNSVKENVSKWLSELKKEYHDKERQVILLETENHVNVL